MLDVVHKQQYVKSTTRLALEEQDKERELTNIHKNADEDAKRLDQRS